MRTNKEIDDHFQKVLKDIALHEELETANKLIRLGFGELQNISPVNDFDFLPFQLLSQGFERFMKCYICIGYLCKHDKYPQPEEIKGHDLEVLLQKILSYFDGESRPILMDDEDFLATDPDLKKLLHILSEFGKRARYYNFDVITGNTKIGEDIEMLWNFFKNSILTRLNLWDKLMDPNLQNEVYGDIACYVISNLEQFVAALARQFTMGAIQEEGQSRSMPFHEFSMLWPDEIGKTDYRKETTRYAHTEHPLHKRTAHDEFERRFNPKYRSKLIKKSEYQHTWPFYEEEVIIECREKHWCVVSINGYDYALNGSASGRYKLENPHDAGMAIPGCSISDFISMTLSLGKE